MEELKKKILKIDKNLIKLTKEKRDLRFKPKKDVYQISSKILTLSVKSGRYIKFRYILGNFYMHIKNFPKE
jgi:hypothetical protein